MISFYSYLNFPWIWQMQRLYDWFPVLSSRPGSSAKGHSEPGSWDMQETVIFPAITISLHQMEGPCTSGAFPVVACIVGASQARQQKEPIMR